MKNYNKPIGVFDSGIGGVTVLEELVKKFPNEDFIYVGDTKYLPYGTKTSDELKKLVSRVSKYLTERDVKAIVIACNTATANSYHLKDEIDTPVIGVIEPTVKYAYNVSEKKNILTIATNVTIESMSYQNALEKLSNGIGNFYFEKCSDFVDAIESNIVNNEASFKLVREKLEKYKDCDIDAIILGCTHFGLYSNELKSVFPNATLVGCGVPTSEYLYKVLDEKDMLSQTKKIGSVEINATSDPEFMQEKISWFKGNYDKVK